MRRASPLLALAVAGMMPGARGAEVWAGPEALEPAPEVAMRSGDGWRVVNRQTALKSLPAGALHPVLRVRGLPADELSRRIVTGELTVALRGEAGEVAARHGLEDLGSPPYAPHLRIFRAPPAAVLALLPRLREDPEVESVEPILARQQVTREVPDDPLFPQQWYLQADAAMDAMDINVTGVWGHFGGDGRRGQGLRIAVLDDGIDAAHPDLAGRLDFSTDRNWNTGPAENGGAQRAEDRHGTAVAGLIAATGNNGLGIVGTAPEATLVSLRLVAGPSTDQMEAEAFSWASGGPAAVQIRNCSWGPPDDRFLLSGPGPLTRAALANGAQHGRNGRGTVVVFSVGNGGELFENSNADGYANNIHVIAVGAATAEGRAAPYSEPGANVCVSAPSSSPLGGRTVVTTDRPGADGFNAGGGGDVPDAAYTRRFGGTSAAAPLVSGVCALVLQSRPELGWRDVKEVLMRSARRPEAQAGGWMTNAAGLAFHDRLGAGAVDAARACSLALRWPGLGPVRSFEVTDAGPRNIPDNDPGGLLRAFPVPRDLRVEHVTLRVRISHPSRGDLRVLLTSPAGTTSLLAAPYYDPFSQADYRDWTFSSVQMWGEKAAGVWRMRVADEVPRDQGRLEAATLTVYGSDPVPPPAFTSAARVVAVVGEEVSHAFQATHRPFAFRSEAGGATGVSLSEDGRLWGVPEKSGLHELRVSAVGLGGEASQDFVLEVLTRYAAWRQRHGLDPAAGDEADADGDQRPDAVEYALGTDPRQAEEAGGPVLEEGGFAFLRPDGHTDVVYSVEVSEDLAQWREVARGAGGSAMTALEEGWEVREEAGTKGAAARITTRPVAGAPAAEALWYRLRVRLLPE